MFHSSSVLLQPTSVTRLKLLSCCVRTVAGFCVTGAKEAGLRFHSENDALIHHHSPCLVFVYSVSKIHVNSIITKHNHYLISVMIHLLIKLSMELVSSRSV